MITPMLFSIYINTTLAHSHAAVKLRRFSLAVDLLLPGFIRRCGKTYPTPSVNFLSSKTLTVYLLFPGWRSCSCSSMPICIFRGPGRARSVFLIRFVISGLMRARRLRRTRHHRHRYSDRQDTHVHALSPLFHLSFLIVFIHISSTISSISFLPLSTPSIWSRSLAQLRIALLIVFSACCLLQIPYRI